MIGCDTGFFVEYLRENQTALDVWSEARRTSERLVLSIITLFELRRLALKGEILRPQTETFIGIAPKLCKVIYLDKDSGELLEQAARIAHGNGLSMADSLIFTAILRAGASVLYTTDSDMAAYKGQGPRIVRL